MNSFKKFKRYLITGFLLSQFFQFCSAANYPIDNRMFFENYSLDEKLAHTHVLSIFQDKTGYLWVGTYGGIQLFNGFNFSDFQVGMIKQFDLANNYVLVTYEDRNGDLWFGTDNGLYYYNRTKHVISDFRSDTANPCSISSNHIRTIYEDDQEIYWIGTYGGGLNKFDLHTGKFIRYTAKQGDPTSLQSDLINKFFVDPEGLFWIGTEHGGISIFDKSRSCVIRTLDHKNSGLSDTTINDIYQDIYGTIWVGTWSGGLNRYNSKTGKFIAFIHDKSQANSLSCNTVRSIAEADENNLWIATFGGGLNLFNVKTEKFQKIEITTTKRKNSSWEFLWTLYKDLEGNLWMGTFGAGLMKYDKLRNTFPEYRLENPKNGDLLGISSVLEDKDGKIWLATLSDGIHILNRQTNEYTSYDKISDRYITILYKDRSDRIWVGTSDGLYMVEPNRKNIKSFLLNRKSRGGMTSKTISSILEDQEGNIWMGFFGGGINIIRKDEINNPSPSEIKVDKLFIDENNRSTINNMWSLFQDRKGRIWIGNSDNLIYYTPATKKINFLPIIDVSTFHEDALGNLWIGTLGKGIYKIDANLKILKNFKIDEGLPDLIVVGMLTDDKGKMWLATGAGLSEFDPENETFINFDEYYGLQRGFYGLNAQTSLSSGELFFGGNSGFNIFYPMNIRRQIIFPKVVISDVQLNYRSILLEHANDTIARINIFTSNLDRIRTEKNTKTISVEFAALNYSITKEIFYSYILEGYDENWIITNADNRRATYANLSGGKYVFKVRASNDKVSWGNQVTSLQIIVQPPFWKTWWFRILLVLLIVLIFIYFYRHRVMDLKQEVSFYKERNLSEKLLNEQELLKIKNKELSNQLNDKAKQLASALIGRVDYSDWLKSVYTRLTEMKSNASAANQSKFNQLLSLFEKKTTLIRQTEYNENFDLIYENFTKRFAEAYPKITHKDLRICSYIRMNKSNKEIAALLSITLRSLEISRYRIRKKMGLSNSVNLNDFILRF